MEFHPDVFSQTRQLPIDEYPPLTKTYTPNAHFARGRLSVSGKSPKPFSRQTSSDASIVHDSGVEVADMRQREQERISRQSTHRRRRHLHQVPRVSLPGWRNRESLLKGGVFLYPPTDTHPGGKLRLLYEAKPLAFIAEQAGGTASSGNKQTLSITLKNIHQRVPLVFGSSREMAKFRNRLCSMDDELAIVVG